MRDFEWGGVGKLMGNNRNLDQVKLGAWQSGMVRAAWMNYLQGPGPKQGIGQAGLYTQEWVSAFQSDGDRRQAV